MSDTEPADENVMASDSTAPTDADPTLARNASDGPHGDEGDALTWMVTAEANPFHRRLVVTTHDTPTLDLLLDPLVVQDLLVALGNVHADQRRVLGLAPLDDAAAAPVHDHHVDAAAELAGDAPNRSQSAGDDDNAMDADGAPVAAADGVAPPPPSTGGPMTLGWWWQHKLLGFLLLFAAVFAGIGALTGSS